MQDDIINPTLLVTLQNCKFTPYLSLIYLLLPIHEVNSKLKLSYWCFIAELFPLIVQR
jgi:hypothetical protein